MTRRPPGSTRTDTLFPYTTLFRSGPPSIRPGTDAGVGSPVSSRLAFPQGSCVTASTLAFVFPGQGSQSLAMLAELSELHPLVREAFVEASDGAGVDLWALSQGGPDEQLNRTEYTQRSEERRVGKECVSTWSCRWSTYH